MGGLLIHTQWKQMARSGERWEANNGLPFTHRHTLIALRFLTQPASCLEGKIPKGARRDETATSKTEAVCGCDVKRCRECVCVCVGGIAKMKCLCQPTNQASRREADESALKSLFCRFQGGRVHGLSLVLSLFLSIKTSSKKTITNL